MNGMVNNSGEIGLIKSSQVYQFTVTAGRNDSISFNTIGFIPQFCLFSPAEGINDLLVSSGIVFTDSSKGQTYVPFIVAGEHFSNFQIVISHISLQLNTQTNVMNYSINSVSPFGTTHILLTLFP